MHSSIALAFAALALVGCATTEALPPPLPAIDVAAVRETEPVGTQRRDAADDPAIWRNAANPSASLIVGTDKRAGIYSYGLDGQRRGFLQAGQINNVDIRDNVMIGGRPVILIGASNRNSLTQPRVTLAELNPVTGAITQLAEQTIGGAGEAYGFCFGRFADGLVRAYVVTKEGEVQESMLTTGGAASDSVLVRGRSWRVGSQPEGCVVDDRTGQLYLGEEDVGIWRIDLMQDGSAPVEFARVGTEDGLVADVEGLALAPRGMRGGYLVASSQGDNAYALFDLESGSLRGRFRINGGAIDGTYDTDGIELMLGDFGADFPGGLFVAQDGDNLPQAQNFKLLSWTSILAALGLPN
jgi:3-phytase